MARSHFKHGHHTGAAPGVIYDAGGGILRKIHFEGDRAIFSEERSGESLQAILDYAHAMRAANNDHKLSAKTRPEGRHAGTIPDVIFYRWQREYEERHKPYGTDWQDFLAKKLNSYEFSAFRTLGRV